jgi:hypothetical protein
VQEHFARHLSEQDMECVRTALAKVLEGNGYPGEQPFLTSVETSAAPQAGRPRAR